MHTPVDTVYIERTGVTRPNSAPYCQAGDNTQRNKGTTLAGLNFSTTQHSFAQTLQVHRDKGPNLSTHVSKTRQNYSKLLRPTDRISRCLNYIHIITYNCNIVIVSIKIAFSKVRCAKQITWCMLMKVDAAGHWWRLWWCSWMFDRVFNGNFRTSNP